MLQSFNKDFEEIFKAIAVRGGDITSWFSSYSQQPGKMSLSRRELSAALQSLSLTRNLSEIDFDNLYAALDPHRTGLLDIRVLEDTLKKQFGAANSVSTLQDDILERIIRAFNGDDVFIVRELSKLDPLGRGLIEGSKFIDAIRSHCPQHVQFSSNDLLFLAKRYLPNSLSGAGLNPLL
jgi:hypothetical protein